MPAVSFNFPADAGFLCRKTALFGHRIKKTSADVRQSAPCLSRSSYSGKISLYGKCFNTLLVKSLKRTPNASSGRYLYVLNASRQFAFRNLLVVSPGMRRERDISGMLKLRVSFPYNRGSSFGS